MSDHYNHFEIEPIEFIMANGLDFCQGNVIKYVCRYRNKGGVEDLKKAIDYLDTMIEAEECADWEEWEVEIEDIEPEEALSELALGSEAAGLYKPDVYPDTCSEIYAKNFQLAQDPVDGWVESPEDEPPLRKEVRKIAMKAIQEGLPAEYEWFSAQTNPLCFARAFSAPPVFDGESGTWRCGGDALSLDMLEKDYTDEYCCESLVHIDRGNS